MSASAPGAESESAGERGVTAERGGDPGPGRGSESGESAVQHVFLFYIIILCYVLRLCPLPPRRSRSRERRRSRSRDRRGRRSRSTSPSKSRKTDDGYGTEASPNPRFLYYFSRKDAALHHCAGVPIKPPRFKGIVCGACDGLGQ